MSRGAIKGLVLAGVVLLGLVVWWAASSMPGWFHDDRPREMPYFSDPLRLAQEVTQRLGAKIVQRHAFDPRIPNGARLVVRSFSDDLDPDRIAFLSDWVQEGGHLVVFGPLDDMGALPEDLLEGVEDAVVPHAKAADDEGDGDDEDAASTAEDQARAAQGARDGVAEDAPASSLPHPPAPVCRTLFEQHPRDASQAKARPFEVCGPAVSTRYVLTSRRRPDWVMTDKDGRIEMLRMLVGDGSVTYIGSAATLRNDQVLAHDNPQVLATALQVRKGSEVWFVYGNSDDETEDPSLMGWFWRHGWVAAVLAMLAVAAALWRAAVRFGPMTPPTPAHRRSMGDQVRGTGEYLRGRGAQALHAAQLRALNEIAESVVPQYAALKPSERIEAIAQATGMPGEPLGIAMSGLRGDGLHLLERELRQLETARRRLLALAAQARAAKSSSSSLQTEP